MLVVKEVKGRNGSIALRMSHQLYSVSLLASTIKCFLRRATRRAAFVSATSSSTDRHYLEPDDGKLSAVRLGCELTMVHENKHHPLSQQGGFVQGQACSITVGKLLPRLLGRQRRKPSRQILVMAIQSSQPGTLEPLSTVSQTFYIFSYFS